MRQKFIFVDELNKNELREFVKQNGLILNEIEIKKVIDNMGFNPGANMQKGLSLDTFITMTLRLAMDELVAFQHQQVLKALKDRPEGISPVFFNNLKNEGVDLSNPKDVGPALRTGNAIFNCIELCKYTIGSKAIEVALRSHDPILPTTQWSLITRL